MARRVRDKDIESREARSKLKQRGLPYWRSIGKGLHLGYRKGQRGGVWVIRRYQGSQIYKVTTVAQADDIEDANGAEILDFWQAQEVARNERPALKVNGYTVADAVADYLEHLEGRASYQEQRHGLAYSSCPNSVAGRLTVSMKTKSANGTATLPSRGQGPEQNPERRRTIARVTTTRRKPTASAKHRLIGALICSERY
jgi:hypothetical protein